VADNQGRRSLMEVLNSPAARPERRPSSDPLAPQEAHRYNRDADADVPHSERRLAIHIVAVFLVRRPCISGDSVTA
ncbi:MAG: hypothetical protein Q9197_006436, partial [Variospora fuerteventurae]